MVTYLDVAENWGLWVKYMPESYWCDYTFYQMTVEQRIEEQVKIFGPE